MVTQMIEVIERAIQNGGRAKGRDAKREYDIDLRQMPQLFALYRRLNALGISMNTIAPMLCHRSYRKGKPCSSVALFRMYQRGKDPVKIKDRTTMYNILVSANGILDILMSQGKFGALQENGKFDGDYPRRGAEARASLKRKFKGLL